MRGDKNGGDGGADPQRTFNRQGTAGLLRRQTQQGQPKPHRSGGAGGGEGVAHPGQQPGAMPVPSSRMDRVMVSPSSVRVMSRRLAWAVMEFWAISRV